MNIRRGQIASWIEERTGLLTAVERFFHEEIPSSSGWHQVFGSVALFLFLLQVVTGVLLALNYAPTPGEAYYSVQYIITELTAGATVRGLHHWGSSLLIIIVVIHMIQVAVYGAYRKPREATWIVGVALFLFVLTFGLTGYLLPWDNRAYWGTVVTTQIIGNTPVIGQYLLRLLGAEGGSVGVITFARFFMMHVFLLPFLTACFIALHLYLVRKHGVAPAAGDNSPRKKFFPEQVFRDTVAIFVSFVVLLAITLAVQAPLGQLADPTDTTYIPRPDWYFLFLFQTLKYFHGWMEVVGTHLLPGLALLALLLLPFVDRGTLKRVRERTVVIGAISLAIAGWISLTVAAVLTKPETKGLERVEIAENAFPVPSAGSIQVLAPVMSAADMEAEFRPIANAESWQTLSPAELAGISYFRQEACFSCHPVGEGESKVGPNLAAVSQTRSAEWMMEHFKRPEEVVPGTRMPPIRLNDKELAALAAFLMRLNPENASALVSAPNFLVKGARIYEEAGCGNCHRVNGEGMKVGPPLNGIGARRPIAWISEKIRDPRKTLPDSVMPPFDLPPGDLELLVDYLVTLPPEASSLEQP